MKGFNYENSLYIGNDGAHGNFGNNMVIFMASEEATVTVRPDIDNNQILGEGLRNLPTAAWKELHVNNIYASKGGVQGEEYGNIYASGLISSSYQVMGATGSFAQLSSSNKIITSNIESAFNETLTVNTMKFLLSASDAVDGSGFGEYHLRKLGATSDQKNNQIKGNETGLTIDGMDNSPIVITGSQTILIQKGGDPTSQGTITIDSDGGITLQSNAAIKITGSNNVRITDLPTSQPAISDAQTGSLWVSGSGGGTASGSGYLMAYGY